jgi:hypothetical protein
VIFGQTNECSQGLLAALNTTALAVENFLNAIAEFLLPVGILGFGVLIVE